MGRAVRAAAVAQEQCEAPKVDSLEATRRVCREIVVEADDGTVLIHRGRVGGKGGGRIEIKDADGVDTIAIGTRPDSRDGAVEHFDDRGQPTSGK